MLSFRFSRTKSRMLRTPNWKGFQLALKQSVFNYSGVLKALGFSGKFYQMSKNFRLTLFSQGGGADSAPPCRIFFTVPKRVEIWPKTCPVCLNVICGGFHKKCFHPYPFHVVHTRFFWQWRNLFDSHLNDLPLLVIKSTINITFFIHSCVLKLP